MEVNSFGELDGKINALKFYSAPDTSLYLELKQGVTQKLIELRERAKLCCRAAEPDHPTCTAEVTTRFDDINAALDEITLGMLDTQSATWSKQLEACEKAYWTPSGFVVSAAFATAWRFVESQWGNGAYARSALWLSAGYEGKRLSYLGLARLQWERGGNDGLSRTPPSSGAA